MISTNVRSLSLLLLLSLPAFTGASNPKRGLAFNFVGHAEDIKKADNSAASWVYGWDLGPRNPSAAGIVNVPMQWGAQDIEKLAQSVQSQGAKVILGFNEPDMPSQANLPAQRAAQLWKQYMDPVGKSGVRLGSPAITSAPTGKKWLSDFLGQCQGCQVDFIAFHWYGEGAQNFINYAKDLHTAFPKYKLWCTEFASTSGDTATFMKDTVAFLDSADYIEKYAWFTFGRDSRDIPGANLLDGNGQLTPIGKQYLS